jgi:beta-ketodecanoyl-[acyl-carrier-protein] synthase
MAAAHIEAHLADLGFSRTQMRRYWLHQANLGMNQLVIKRLVGRRWATTWRPSSWANTPTPPRPARSSPSTSTMPTWQPGDLGVICSFGAGYSIGSVVVSSWLHLLGDEQR